MPHNTSISEFERQKQDRIVIIKDLIRSKFIDLMEYHDHDDFPSVDEKELSKLVKNILVEIDKV